jgi:hypothetical protein
MIVANVRQGLGRDDAQLALRLIARGSGEALETAETTLRDRGIDHLLDDPRLLSALLEARQGAHASFALFAYVMVRHALRTAGEDDRTLADYVASIMVHFGKRDRALRIAEADDQTYDTVAALLGDVEDGDAQRAFLVRAHLGSYALWLSGLFPDFIETRRWRRGGPDLDYYEEMGRRGFQLAAAHRLAAQHGMTALFAEAAEKFAVLRLALNSVSDRLFFPNVNSPERLMRQVRSESRWRFAS